MKDKRIVLLNGESISSCAVCHPDTLAQGWCKQCIDVPENVFTCNPVQTLTYNMIQQSPNASFVVASKTGTGKTWCAYLAMLKHFEHNPNGKVLWTCPLKQIAREKVEEMPSIFENANILELTGDTMNDVGVGSKRNNAIKEADIISTSQEMLDSLSRKPDVYTAVDDITMIVIDEIHGLGDIGRGGKFDGALTRFLLRMQRLGRVPQIVALSATFDNIDDLKRYFEQFVTEFTVITSDFTPIKANIDPSIHSYVRSNQYTILSEVEKYMDKPGGILVLQLSIPGCKRMADAINERYGDNTAKTNFSEMSKLDKIETIQQFNRGEFKVLCATPVVLAGVNIGCTVIILDVTFFNTEKMEIDVLAPSSIRQAAGRVGRPPQFNEGWVSYIANETLKSEVEYALAAPNIIRGAMLAALEQVINVEVSLQSASNQDLENWFIHSYSGLSKGDNIHTDRFNSAMQFLTDKGYIIDDTSILQSTSKGKIVSQNFIDPVFFEYSIELFAKERLIDNTEKLMNYMGLLFTHPKSPVSWTRGKSQHIEKCFSFAWMKDKKLGYSYNWGITQGRIQWAETASFAIDRMFAAAESLGYSNLSFNIGVIKDSLSLGVIPLPLIVLGRKLTQLGVSDISSKFLLYLYLNDVRVDENLKLIGPTSWRLPEAFHYDKYTDSYSATRFKISNLFFKSKCEEISQFFGRDSESSWLDEVV